MNPYQRVLVWLTLSFATYHLARDILQIFNVENVLTTYFHLPHAWCGAYCNYVTLPFEIIAIIASIVVLRRDRVGTIGTLALLFAPTLFLATILLP